MTDPEHAEPPSTGRPASPGRHRASREDAAATAGPHRLPRAALAGLGVVALAVGVLAATSAAGTPTRPVSPQPGSTGSALTGAARLSLGAPPGAKVLTATPVHVARPAAATPAAVHVMAVGGIPAVALDAYRLAAARMGSAQPDCGLPWQLLAGIGRIESNHGRYGGASLTATGESRPHIIGPALDGTRYDYIADTDGGRLDGDPRVDHAVGPMQFIPATWAMYGIDGNGDRVASPFNIADAALAAARYLCAAGGDLRTAAGQRRAVLAYNHSDEYLALVLATAQAYATGTPPAGPVQGVATGPLPPVDTSWLPPVNPGRPAGAPAASSGAAPSGSRPAGSDGSAGTGSSGGGAAGSSSSGGGPAGTGSPSGSDPAGGGSAGGSTGSSSSSRPAPTSSPPAPPEPSQSPSQPAPVLPLPSISLPAILPSPTGSTGCTQVVLGIVVPVPCGSS
ncbi:lytic transglycosylase domain-containing protein [Jatrophihabitans sp.]|uniref:lytic transglycosylase domain-containing protein n=1 Tax=Jatrophihabitans sp. TaxID=1932789 RepID=UPI002CDB4560|nr:lytic transglycosylase domain-containing protein [Jatrophihabitans sp.]